MGGPYSLGERAVGDHTWSEHPGVYKLMMTRYGPVRYVGRSDSDVRARLLQHVREGDYNYFWVVHESDPVAAFLRECRLWHRHRGTIDNDKVHPARPAGCREGCPTCSHYD
ncbi:MAG: hypothetical protein ACE5IJ_09105 [Thermoplasmata archaeon]